MYELGRTIPDVKMLLAPEELGSTILFLARARNPVAHITCIYNSGGLFTSMILFLNSIPFGVVIMTLPRSIRPAVP